MELKGSTEQGALSLLSHTMDELRETFRERFEKMASALKQVEEDKKNLTAKIDELKETIKEKEGLIAAQATKAGELAAKLEERHAECKQLEKNCDLLSDQMAQMESRVNEAEARAVREAGKSKELNESMTARIDALQGQIRGKDELLHKRDEELTDLRARVQALVSPLSQIGSLIKKVETLAFGETQGESGAISSSSVQQRAKEKERLPRPKNHQTAPQLEQSQAENVPSEFFDRMVWFLADAMGPKAGLLVRDQLVALGEPAEAFPKRRLPELVDLISQKILDDSLKMRFRHEMAEQTTETSSTVKVEPGLQVSRRTVLPSKEEPGAEATHVELGSEIQSFDTELQQKQRLPDARDAKLQELEAKMAGRVHQAEFNGDPSQAEINSIPQAKEDEITELKPHMKVNVEGMRAELKEKKTLRAEMDRDRRQSKGLLSMLRTRFHS